MRIEVRTEVEAPKELVFRYVADLTNNPVWQSGVAETTWTSPLPVTPGTTCEQRLDDGSVVRYRVVAVDPGESITIESLPGASVAATITRTVQELGVARSRVRMELQGRVRGWRFLLTPLMKWLIRRAIESDYRRLKRVMEAEEEPSGE